MMPIISPSAPITRTLPALICSLRRSSRSWAMLHSPADSRTALGHYRIGQTNKARFRRALGRA
jgi:hypothetical protein